MLRAWAICREAVRCANHPLSGRCAIGTLADVRVAAAFVRRTIIDAKSPSRSRPGSARRCAAGSSASARDDHWLASVVSIELWRQTTKRIVTPGIRRPSFDCLRSSTHATCHGHAELLPVPAQGLLDCGESERTHKKTHNIADDYTSGHIVTLQS
jgi:hypothetical protein